MTSAASVLVGRNLRRALDLKVKKLRSLLTADEDITTELDRIVCRLMKLALRTSEDHQMPPPATWMQRKLLDLLSLTEKAIERRRKHFIENYPLKAIEYGQYDNRKNNIRDSLILNTIQNDNTADKIVDKYLILSSDPTSENFVVKSELHYTEENLSITSNEIDPFTGPKSLYGEVRLESMKSESKEEIRLEITQGWVDGDYETAPINDYIDKSNVESSDSNTSNDSQYRIKKRRKNYSGINDENIYEPDMHISSKHRFNKISKISNNKRQSKNKLIRKISKKHSSSSQLPKSHSKKMEFMEYKSYTFNKPKRSFKECYSLQPTLSKPIPRSLIELCYQDLSREKSDKLIESALCKNNKISDNVAATKESFIIDIVAEDLEESFALRRSIATEMDQKSDIMESEAILETVINVTKDDSFDTNYLVPFENIDSETIFLYDLNEPSTSKGIRHLSADAQCGTDRICCISPTVNSLMNLSNKCETGIKIGDSFTKLRFNKNTVDFGTVTDGINFYRELSMYTTNALKIKDSNEILPKTLDCATMTQVNDFMLDNILITPILNALNTRETSSEQLRCLKNPSDSGMSQIISVTRYIRPKLSCCGIHVHSYRDRQVSEDVVFQGEWQRRGPTIVAKKSPCSLNSRKRESVIKKKVNSKEKIIRPWKQKNVLKESKNISIHKQNVKNTNLGRDIIAKTSNKKSCVQNNIAKTLRNNHNISKVASKIVTSVTTSKSVKNIVATKNIYGLKYTSRTNYGPKTHVNKKEDLPCPSPKKGPISTSHKLNIRVDNRKSPNNLPVTRSKTTTKEFKDNVIKFSNDKRKNITYLVFRNEIDNSRSAITSSANSKVIMKLDDTKNNYSSTSQNSSPCSSPNSIATVRALSTKSKSYCNKRNSTSPEKINSKNLSEENTEHKNKQFVKSTKSIKMIDQSSSSCENKENLPQTSNKYDTFKDFGKSSKALVSDRNKNVFMLQVSAESPPSIAKRKSDCVAKIRSSSSTKILKNKNVDNNHRALSPSSFNKSIRNKHEFLDGSYIYDETYVPEINNLTRSSTPILDKTASYENHESVNEQIKDTRSPVKRSNSKINAAMKQLIEERLSFIKRIKDKNDSDSETIVLSRDDQENSVNEGLSPISYKTVVTNEDICNISGRDIEKALLKYSFDSNLDSFATLGSTHSTLPSMETDLHSFRSAESMSKCSKYLHHNELDNTLVPQQSSNTKTVRDLFERKDQPLLKNAGGALAVQVFSGYSMDGEPIVGDQAEYTRLVDPETGNLTLEVPRQATSEELFVSGRSSDTYESCYVEDDAFLPNWLFHIISQQQSAEIPEEEEEPEPDDQSVEPEYDGNGNIDAGLGAGVGAGDGHGMHSDQSQDSSGRGTSISSSDVSSGPQSEAILIDPSAFLGSGVRTEPPIGTSVVPVVSSDISFRTVDNTTTNNEAQYIRENAQRHLTRLAVASDADADVSSLETDAADSDN